MSKPVVYSKPNCVQCTMTKRALDNAGIDYDVIDISEDAAALDKVMALGHRAAPVVIIPDAAGEPATHWSGFQPDKIAALTAA
jgi:glutaredoxin-like protein NrdH